MKFNEMDLKRRKQVETQVTQFEERFKDTTKEYNAIDIILTPDLILKNYLIHKDVFQSDRMVSIEFARWIAYNNGEYYDKNVIDMFCGGGIQGITALMMGAKHVTFVDSSEYACKNTLENLNQYNLRDRATVIQSDLFQNVKQGADIMLANPPFFPSEGIEGKVISKTMCMPTEKLEEFYQKMQGYAPKVAVCHWDFAGNENSPESMGITFGLNVERRLCLKKGYGLQQISGENNEYFFKVIMLQKYVLQEGNKK